MLRKMLFAALAATAISLSAPAKAATYEVSYDGSVFDVFAQISVDGSDNVTAISGNVVGVNGGSITGLEPLGNPSWIYDNKFFASSPYVDNGGILFNAAGFLYNLYSSIDGTTYFLSTFNPDGSNYNPGDTGSLAVAQTPLPGAIWLFGTALAGLASLLSRRRRGSAQRLGAPAYA
jgi:hypothetical protein